MRPIPIAARAQARERVDRILVLDRAMTAVEADPDVIPQEPAGLLRAQVQSPRQIRGADRIQPALEEGDGLVGGLEHTVRLGLEGEMQEAARLPVNPDEPLGDADDIRGHPLPVLASGPDHPRLVRQRHGRDAALDALRQEPGENRGEVERVGHTRIRPPVRRVHRRLHRFAVEGSVGKPVEDGDVQALCGEEGVERVEPSRLQELPRLARAQAQPEAERRLGRQPRLQRRGEPPQRGVIGCPALGGMDVGAVGQVKRRIGTEQHCSPADPGRLADGRRGVELARLAEKPGGVLEDHAVDQIVGQAPAAHLHDEPRHGQRVARPPVARAGHADPIGAVLLDQVHGALSRDLRLRIERQAGPVAAGRESSRSCAPRRDRRGRAPVRASDSVGARRPRRACPSACPRDAACGSESAGGGRRRARPARRTSRPRSGSPGSCRSRRCPGRSDGRGTSGSASRPRATAPGRRTPSGSSPSRCSARCRTAPRASARIP